MSVSPILEVSPRDYHSKLGLDRSNIFSEDSYLSKSRLWELKSKSLYKWRFFEDDFKATAAMTWGSLIDCYITTPDEVSDYIVYNPFPNFKTKAAQELRDATIAAGKVIVSADEQKRVETAVDRIKSNRIAGPIVEECRKQVVLLNHIRDVRFKGLVDLVPENSPCLYDFKTIAKLTPRDVSKAISEYGYHIQSFLYLKLWNLCHPEDPRNRFRLIWQESSPPYEVAVSEIPAFDLASGEEWVVFQLKRLIEATQKNCWPNAFGDKVAMIGRPSYASFGDEEEMEGPATAPSIEDNAELKGKEGA